jgi:hypothetical protein
MPKAKKSNALVAPVASVAPPASSGGFKAAEYNEVAMAASLLEIRLLKTNFIVEPEFYAVQDEARLSFGREVVSCAFEPDKGTVAAIFKYHVYGKQGRSKLLRCEAEYTVIYEVSPTSPEEAARGFCRNVGGFAAYPYFRALVSQLTWGAGVALPPLPAIASTAHIPPKSGAEASSPDDQGEKSK